MAVRSRIAGVVLVLTAAAATIAFGYSEHDETMTVASFAGALRASDGFAGDGFGVSVDVDGDVMVVGAIGAAYVFTRSDGRWLQTAKLSVQNTPLGPLVRRFDPDDPRYQSVDGQYINLGNDGVVYGGFGRAVAVDGDVVVVGAYEAAYVFTAANGEWVEAAKLNGLDDLSGLGLHEDGSHTSGRGSTLGFLDGGFGSSVAVHGDLVVVGANGLVRAPHTDGQPSAQEEENTFSAYVFDRIGDKWPLVAWLAAPSGSQSHNYARDVAVDGNTLVVGGHAAVYVYERSGEGWSEPATLALPEDSPVLGFGQSVAVARNEVVVASTGAAHLFERSGKKWTGELLEPSFNPASRRYGLDVAVEEGLAVIAPFDDSTGPGTSPIVFSLFDRPREGWRLTWTAGFNDPAWKVQSLAMGGGVIAVGAHLSSYEASEDLIWHTKHQEPGEVHIFDLEILHPVEEEETTTTPTAVATPTATATQTATAVATPTATATQTATAVATPTATATQAATAVATPTATAVATTAVAQPVLVDDDDSSGGGVNLVWAGVIIALLVLVVLVIANFVMRRKPSDDAGRYTT